MAGFRLGWAVAPKEIAEKIGLMIQTVFSAVPPFIQYAGIAALTGDQSQILVMKEEYRKRREVIVDGLNSLPGVSCITPQGAFYAFPNITATGMTSDEFANFALEKAEVALLPGNTFGQHGEGYVRLCYANSKENIKEGLERLNKALNER
jgi:aspartate/methionine/tyrosine aminotransferase